MSTYQFSRGKVAYGQGSYAPTRGPVSAQGAQGYLQREIRNQNVNKVGGDGQSDSRSGVAAAALSRSKLQQPGQNGPNIRINSDAKGGLKINVKHNFDQSQIKNAINSGSNTKPAGTGGYKPPPTANQGDGTTPNTGAPVGPSVPAGSTQAGGPPPMVVNENGTMSLPYDTRYAQTAYDALQGYNSQLLDLQNQRQQQAMDYMNQGRQADQQYTDTKLSTLNNAAGNGTAFSSGYGLAVGRNAEDYNNYKNQIAAQNTLKNQYFDNQAASIYNTFNQQLANGNGLLHPGAFGTADNTATDSAGTLGLGTTPTPTAPAPTNPPNNNGHNGSGTGKGNNGNNHNNNKGNSKGKGGKKK